jgi:hypothetical protein
MKPTVFPSQAKEQAATKADVEEMKQDLHSNRFFQVSLAERTRLTFAALSMRSLWNARLKKQDRIRKADAKSSKDAE